MNRFYVEKKNISGDRIRVTDPKDIRHLVTVLRLSSKEEIKRIAGEFKNKYQQLHVLVKSAF